MEEIKEGRQYDWFACFGYEDGIIVKLMNAGDFDPNKFEFEEDEQEEDIGVGENKDRLLPDEVQSWKSCLSEILRPVCM